jgi:hypothetical protein
VKLIREPILQRDDERPPSIGRPSLLSKDQPAEADRINILTGLETQAGKPARALAGAAPAAKARGTLVWGAAATGVLAFTAAVAVWMSSQPDTEAYAAMSATPIRPAPPPTPAEAPVAAPATATIIEETAAVSPAVDNTRSLKEMLNDSPEAGKAPRDELTAALERPHSVVKSKPKLAQATEHKKTEQRQAKVAKVAQKSEQPVKAKTKAAPDSDVALLAALMAHVQAGQPSKAPSTPAYLLKQCGLQNEAGAAQCRAHLCANAARKEPECKSAAKTTAPVKTASES